MMSRVRVKSVIGYLWPLAAVMTLLAAGLQPQAQSEEPAKLPEGVTEIRKEHLLNKIPNFFFFDYEGEPQPGKRLWLRIDDKHWVERYRADWKVNLRCWAA